MLEFTRWEKIGITAFCLAIVAIMIACADIEDNSEIPATSTVRDYNYLDDALITKGFYKDFICVVTQEMRRSIKCIVVQHKNPDVDLDEKFRTRIEVPKSDVKKQE